MMLHPSSLAALACAGMLVACVAPKAAVVNQTPKAPAKAEVTDNPQVVKSTPDDGFRTGDLLALPKDTEYHATNPTLPKPTQGTGTVIVNPPSPPKPKPKPPPSE